MTAIYTASATATGEGRNGHSRSSDGIVDVDLATPVEMGGPGGATNPEQLFAAGYAACFLSALKLIARRKKADIRDAAVTADVGLNATERAGSSCPWPCMWRCPESTRRPPTNWQRPPIRCVPYSNATRGNIDVAVDTIVG